MDNDLISRSKACEMLLKQPQLTPSIIRRILLQVPTVEAVEVVRCKDCKSFGVYQFSGTGYCKNQQGIVVPEPDDFCSYGERKEGAE